MLLWACNISSLLFETSENHPGTKLSLKDFQSMSETYYSSCDAPVPHKAWHLQQMTTVWRSQSMLHTYCCGHWSKTSPCSWHGYPRETPHELGPETTWHLYHDINDDVVTFVCLPRRWQAPRKWWHIARAFDCIECIDCPIEWVMGTHSRKSTLQRVERRPQYDCLFFVFLTLPFLT